MPWKRTDPMEERMRLVMEVESEVFQMSELCERYGVSRKTGYKWLERYRKEGVAGLQDRSRAPLHCPHSAKCSSRPGIVTRMQQRQSASTAQEILKQAGLIEPNPTPLQLTKYLRPTSRESFGPGIDATVIR